MRCTRGSYISSIRYHNGTAAQSWDPELLEESCSLMLLVIRPSPALPPLREHAHTPLRPTHMTHAAAPHDR